MFCISDNSRLLIVISFHLVFLLGGSCCCCVYTLRYAVIVVVVVAFVRSCFFFYFILYIYLAECSPAIFASDLRFSFGSFQRTCMCIYKYFSVKCVLMPFYHSIHSFIIVYLCFSNHVT